MTRRVLAHPSRRRAAIGISLLVGIGAVSSAGQTPSPPAFEDLKPLAPIMDCADLVQGAAGEGTRITSATAVADGQPAPYCRVLGVIDPAIRFEVRLPLARWTQRFLQTGCGGLCGNLNINVGRSQGCVPATNGELVLASTDMGHSGGGTADPTWAAEHPQARVDFAYRGVHLTAVAAKVLVERYYGQPPRYSYFSGCSDGGREALMEAQRFPEDFDGIAAGAPAMNFITQNTFYHGWNARMNTGADGAAILTSDRLPILHKAALDACDGRDGVVDGVIDNPPACAFDPSVTRCRDGQDAAICLTAAQVNVARELYRGAHDTEGRKFVISGPEPGSELGWQGVFVPAAAGGNNFSASIALGTIKYLAYPTPRPGSYTLQHFQFDRATFDAVAPMHALYDSTNPDLSRFQARGGKLLMFHGWADPHISPLNSIAYYTAMERVMGGEAAVSRFARLFLFPGGGHCNGGEGPFDFALLAALMSWTERGIAPDQLLASRSTGGARGARGGVAGAGPQPTPTVDRVRPVFPYPLVAAYRGAGDVDDAASFERRPGPRVDPSRLDWLGASFYSAGYEQWCEANGPGLACRATPQAPTQVQAPRFEVDPLWPKPLPKHWVLGSTVGVSVDARDHVWIIHRPQTVEDNFKAAAVTPPAGVCCTPAPPVLEFDPEGNLVSAWGGPGQGYEWPESNHGITVDHKGNVWIGGNDDKDAHILKFSSTGSFLLQIGRQGARGGSNDPRNLWRAAKIVVDPSTNEAYVADGYGNHRVVVFDAGTGAYKRHWGAYGERPDDTDLGAYDPVATPVRQFRTVHCAMVSNDGFVYVCDRVNNRVQVFRKDGTFVKEAFFETKTLRSGSVWDLAFSHDPEQAWLYLADGVNEQVRIVRRSPLELVTSFGDGGRQPGQFFGVHNIATDSKGNIYTTETYTGARLQRFIYKGLGTVATDQGVAWPRSGSVRNDLPQPYRTTRDWGELPPGMTWPAVTAVEPAPDGSIYVVERCFANSCAGRSEPPILKYSPAGKLLASWGQGMFVFPHGATVDREGNLWVADARGENGKGHQVFKFSPQGKVLMTLGRPGVSGSGPDLFDQPTDVLVAPNGDIFVTDSHRNGLNNRVVKFTKDGRFIKEWGSKGSGPGEISEPHTIAMDSRGRLFVGDRENNRIQIFDQDGTLLDQWYQFGRPSGIAITADDTIYVADSESGPDTGAHELRGIRKGIRIGSARTGEVTAFIEDMEPTAPDHSGAEGVGVDADGNVYGAVVRRQMLERHVRK